jgi:hypothetical protein
MGKRTTSFMVTVIISLLLTLTVSPVLAAARHPESNRYTALTEDGVELAMKRYRPDSRARFRTRGQPLILAPGITANINEFYICTPEGEHYNVQLPSNPACWARGDRYIEKDHLKYYSLAHYLWNRGYDVWLFNYRGQGRGEYTSGGASGYSVDDLGIYDLPAVIEKVY